MFPWDTGGMYTVELYARVRRAVHVEGRSQREVAREFGLARKTVRKMLEYAVPGISGRSQCGARSWDRGRLPSTPFWKRTRAGHESRGTPRSGSVSDYEKSTGTRVATRS